MDKLRLLSTGVLVTTLVLSLILISFSTMDIGIVTAYCGFSLGLFMYVLTKPMPISASAMLMEKVMSTGKLVKVAMKNSPLPSDLEMDVSVKEDAVYMQDMGRRQRASNPPAKEIMAAGLAAVYFNLPSASAGTLKCCKPFFLKYYNYVKYIRGLNEKEIQYVTDDWVKPGPMHEDIYINGTYTCSYDYYCDTAVVHILGELVKYMVPAAILFVVTKSVLYGYNIFKTPTSTVRTTVKRKRYSDKIKKHSGEVYKSTTQCDNDSEDDETVEVTVYRYFNWTRLIILIAFVLGYVLVFKAAISLIKITPVEAVTILSNSKITINGRKSDTNTFLRENAGADWISIVGPTVETEVVVRKRVRRDVQEYIPGRVTRAAGGKVSTSKLKVPQWNDTNENMAVLQTSCEYDVVDYVLSGNFIATCVPSNITKMLPRIHNPSITSIDKRCMEKNTIQHLRAGVPYCYLDCVTDSRCEVRFNPTHTNTKNYNLLTALKSQYVHTERLTIKYVSTVDMMEKTVVIETMIQGHQAGTFIMEGFTASWSNSLTCAIFDEDGNPDHDVTVMCDYPLVISTTLKSNAYMCVEGTTDQVSQMPIWRQITDSSGISRPELVEAGVLSIPDAESTVTTDNIDFNIKVRMLSAKQFQDNLQQAGGITTMVYSYLALVTDNSGTDFNLFNKLSTQTKRSITPLPKSYSYSQKADEASFNDLEILSYEKFSDLVTTSASIVSDYYNSPTTVTSVTRYKVIPVSPSDIAKCSTTLTTTTTGCTYLVEAVQQVTVIGNYNIVVRFLGVPIVKVSSSSNICSDVTAIAINKQCYVFDNSVTNTHILIPMMLDEEATVATMTYKGDYTGDPNSRQLITTQPVGRHNMQCFSKQDEIPDTRLYFTKNGYCVNMIGNVNRFCEGNSAYKSAITYFHSKLKKLERETSVSLTKESIVMSNPDYHHHVICKTTDGTTSCHEELVRNKTYALDDNTRYSVKVSTRRIEVQKGEDSCSSCILVDIRESLYRATTLTIMLILLAGAGYIALAAHLVICLVCFINPYTIGQLARKLKLTTFLSGWKKTICCKVCGMKIFSTIEQAKHDSSCNKQRCPYCLLVNKEGDICQLNFRNKVSHKTHMNLHKWMRLNPYVAGIKIRRSRPLAFYLYPILLASTLMPYLAESTFQDAPTGLRSDKVGTNITVPEKILKCSSISCQIISSYRANIPLTDSSALVVRGTQGDKVFSNRITIQNPRFDTSTDFKFASCKVEESPKMISYTCIGKSECNYDSEDSMLFSYLPGHDNDNDYIPVDLSKPLDAKYCPRATSCLSPIIDFLWLSAGCWTVNDGTAIGHAYYRPIISDMMQFVFSVTITNIGYDACIDGSCKPIKSDESEIESGLIKFQHISNNLPTKFNVAVSARLGDTKPSMIFYGAPDIKDNTDGTPFAYKMTKITTKNTCASGSSYNGGHCQLSTSGSSPSMMCSSFEPDTSVNAISMMLEPLSSVYHCNFEKSYISWISTIEKRSVVIAGKTYSDEIPVTIPSLHLVSENCNLGFTELDMVSLGGLTLDLVRNSGTIRAAKCVGQYNRNNMAKLILDMSSHQGLMELHCPSLFSETCLVNTAKTNSCNVTVSSARNATCVYNNQSIIIDCSDLRLFTPDPTSGSIIGHTGSELPNTWIPSFSMNLGSWWETTLITIAGIAGASLIAWVMVMTIKTIGVTRAARMKSAQMNLGNYSEVEIDDDLYNSVSEMPMKSDNGVRRRNLATEGNRVYSSRIATRY